jgi:alkylation response protein AidB-like acyl-CoA dehydrogenase
MDFGLSEEQELLRQEVRKFLDERCPMDQVRALMASPEGYAPELWREMGQLGWLGLIVPEAHGGAGLGWVDLIVLLEETGRSLYPSPLVATTLAAAALAATGTSAQQERWLPGLADGSTIGTLAILEDSEVLGPSGIALTGKRDGDGFVLSGQKRFVLDAGAADLFVVAFRSGAASGDISLALVERNADGVGAESHPTMDQTKRMGTLNLRDVRVPADALLGAPDQGWPATARLLDLGAVAVTGEMVGAAEGAHALTVQYAKDRIQFEQPIGRYQGVKHPLAEMYVDIESFKSLLYYAAWAADENPEQLPAAVSRAKAYASEAFARLGIDGVQLHGAVGYTAEFDIQLYLKRSKWARPAFGDADYHYDRVATLGGL